MTFMTTGDSVKAQQSLRNASQEAYRGRGDIYGASNESQAFVIGKFQRRQHVAASLGGVPTFGMQFCIYEYITSLSDWLAIEGTEMISP